MPGTNKQTHTFRLEATPHHTHRRFLWIQEHVTMSLTPVPHTIHSDLASLNNLHLLFSDVRWKDDKKNGFRLKTAWVLHDLRSFLLDCKPSAKGVTVLCLRLCHPFCNLPLLCHCYEWFLRDVSFSRIEKHMMWRENIPAGCYVGNTLVLGGVSLHVQKHPLSPRGRLPSHRSDSLVMPSVLFCHHF